MARFSGSVNGRCDKLQDQSKTFKDTFGAYNTDEDMNYLNNHESIQRLQEQLQTEIPFSTFGKRASVIGYLRLKLNDAQSDRGKDALS